MWGKLGCRWWSGFVMNDAVVSYKAAFATALDLWAESRERAISEVAHRAACFAAEGREQDAAYFRFVGRLLSVRALHERAQSVALRSTMSLPTLAEHNPAHAFV
jgi:hypothetical protein